MQLVLHDAIGASDGQTWAQRHRSWSQLAPQLGYAAYDTGEGYRTYWNQVRSLVRKYPMLRETWEAFNPGKPAPGTEKTQ
jgi:hypothetical protein